MDFIEAPRSPLLSQLTPPHWYPMNTKFITELVPLYVQVSPQGYAVCLNETSINSVSDIVTFFNTATKGTSFAVWGYHRLESIVKWFGKHACAQFLAGFTVDGIRFIPKKSIAFARRSRVYDIARYFIGHSIEEESRLASGCSQVLTAFLNIGMKVAALNSPASVFQDFVLSNSKIPKVNSVPLKALDMAWNCMRGGWIEAISLGFHEEIYDYDIISSYPNTMRGLPDITQGNWVTSTQYQSGALLGFVKAEVQLYNTTLSPISVRIRSHIYSPYGKLEMFLTKAELDAIIQYKLGSFKILEGHWMYSSINRLPFEDVITEIFEAKTKLTGLERSLVKTMSVSLFGKFLQISMISGKLMCGRMFNPVYGAEVLARARINVFDMVKNDQQSVASIAIDGVMSKKQLNVRLGENLGDWRLEVKGPSIIMGSGLHTIKGKKTELDLFELAQGPVRRKIDLGNESYATITACLGTGLNFEDACVKRVNTRQVPVNYDVKRWWIKRPGNTQELLKSNYNGSRWHTSSLVYLNELAKEQITS